jgi:hypothetical protein
MNPSQCGASPMVIYLDWRQRLFLLNSRSMITELTDLKRNLELIFSRLGQTQDYL